VTDNCQFDCIHCSVPERQSGHSRLNREDLLRVVRQSLELGVSNITFTGGEPLLNPDLETLIASVPQDKALTQVFTNGFILDNSRAARLKEAGAFAVQISLDSPDPEEHDRLRNMPGAFDGVRRAVEAALQADLFVGLSTYVTNSSLNQGSLDRIYQLARNWGAHELSVFDVIPTGRLLHDNGVLLTPKSRQALRSLERKCNSHRRGPTSLVTQNWSNSARGFARSFGCLAGNYQFHISAFGEFMPCDFTPISFGNVRQYSIEQLWEKLINHPAWCNHQNDCRMQSADFRSRYIDPLPPGIELPAPIEMLDQLAGREVCYRLGAVSELTPSNYLFPPAILRASGVARSMNVISGPNAAPIPSTVHARPHAIDSERSGSPRAQSITSPNTQGLTIPAPKPSSERSA
jgi:MoaA/NifB/PqqE/SkfB family radical SAM enzyme